MKKSILSFSVFFLFFFASRSQNALPINFTDKLISIDAAPTEWDTSIFSSFAVVHKNFPSCNNRVRVNFKWDEQYLYGCYLVSDQKLVRFEKGNENPRLNLNDGVEFYIDPLNDSKNRMDINDYQFIFDAFNQYVILKGDKNQIKNLEIRAPKEPGIATLSFKYASAVLLQDANSVLYCVEFSIPWAGLGVEAKTGHFFKIDACANDADTLLDIKQLPESADIPQYSFASITGYNDFSYPDKWKLAQLKGEPGLMSKSFKKYTSFWTTTFILVTISALLIIFLLFRRINSLKMVPVREELTGSFLQQVVHEEEISELKKETPELFKKLKQYILSNLEEDIGPEDLAVAQNMSLRQLQRVFKEEINNTPVSFIISVKMEEAARLLHQPGKNVSDVAYDLGFADPSYFSRVFKKYYSISPKDFVKS